MNWRKIRIPFGWFCIVFFCLFFIIQNHNHRFDLCDFKVYYLAAQNALADKPVYNQVFGISSGFYKYSPVVLLFFLPFTILPYYAAASLYFIILSLLIYLTIKKLTEFIPKISELAPSVKPQLQMYLLILIAGVQLQRELHVGNVNIILLFACIAALEMVLENKIVLPGILLGIVVLFKPHFLILLPLLLLYRKWPLLLASVGTIVFGLILPAFKWGIQGNIDIHKQWLGAMGSHNAGAELSQAVNTIQRWCTAFVPNTPHGEAAITLICLVALFSMVLWIMIKERRQENPQAFFPLAFFILIGAVPNITVTDTEHFMFSMPLIAYLLIALKSGNLALRILTIIAFVAYGGNWYDLWGRDLSLAIAEAGTLGLGNLAIVILTIIFYQHSSVFSGGGSIPLASARRNAGLPALSALPVGRALSPHGRTPQ
jgi:hypothetical protein